MKITIPHILIIAILTSVSIIAVNGQSTDQSNPTPLSSTEVTIKGPKKTDQQYYYSFTAGPGEVAVSINVKAKSYSTFVGVKIYDAEMNVLASQNMNATTSSPGIALRKFDVGDRQTLLLSFSSDTNLSECRIKLSGAVEFGPSPSEPLTEVQPQDGGGSPLAEPESVTDTETTPTETPAEIQSAGKNGSFMMSILDAVGQRFNIPANGRLQILMKDGSVQEVDLARVKKILIKK